MTWQDILIERLVTEDEIVDALAKAFELPTASVGVIGATTIADSDSWEIVFERWETEGDFAVHVHVALRTEVSIALAECHGDIEIVGRIARTLNSACFIGDDDINPFTGLLIRGPHDVRPARLDAQAEDEGVYRLAPVAAHVG
jgi:hypothetical protein